jgi:hypothetical protein
MSNRFPHNLIASVGCLLALLAGCAPGDSPAIPAAGNQFDGIYQGENRLVGGGGYPCGPPSYLESVTVSHGAFVYQFAVNPPRTTPMPVQILADGSIHGQMQYAIQDYTPRPNIWTTWVTVTGRINGATLDAVAADERCTRRLILQKT